MSLRNAQTRPVFSVLVRWAVLQRLIHRLSGAKGPYPNRVSADIEQAVLDHALIHPCHGAVRVEKEPRLKGLQVSADDIRGSGSATRC